MKQDYREAQEEFLTLVKFLKKKEVEKQGSEDLFDEMAFQMLKAVTSAQGNFLLTEEDFNFLPQKLEKKQAGYAKQINLFAKRLTHAFLYQNPESTTPSFLLRSKRTHAEFFTDFFANFEKKLEKDFRFWFEEDSRLSF